MNAALHELGALALTKMHPAKLFAETNIALIIHSFRSETEKILLRFSSDVLTLNSEKKLELRIQQIQSCLINIADTIVANHQLYKKTYPDDLKLEELYESCLSNIEFILSFIETHYKQYFNLDQKVPDNYLLISRNHLKASIKKLKAHFTAKGLDNHFIQIALYPHLRLINDTNLSYSYRDLIYSKKLLAYQQEILSVSTQNLKKQLIESLFYFNCNSGKVYTFYINALMAELQSELSLQQKANILALRIKEINQLQQKPGFAFNTKAASIKEQVSLWMEEELLFIDRQLQLNPSYSIPHQTTAEEDGINVSLTVKELAMFAGVMMDTGIISNKNKTYVAQKMAGLFRTKDNHIKPHSMTRKIHLKEEHTMQSLKDHLIKMLNLVNKKMDQL